MHPGLQRMKSRNLQRYSSVYTNWQILRQIPLPVAALPFVATPRFPQTAVSSPFVVADNVGGFLHFLS